MKCDNIIHIGITWLVATVWLINGLVCKLLHVVPRHELIVARILGPEHATAFTTAIGIAEIMMFIWIISGIAERFCAFVQILIIALMNAIEFIRASDLLLFGKMNALVALAFITLIFYNESCRRKSATTA